MRARLAIVYSAQALQLREVVLKDKPQAMLEASPKGTVPVLLLPDAEGAWSVIDESLDVMLWALEHHDPEGWLARDSAIHQAQLALIDENDTQFKTYLDRYKYSDRFPEHPASYYRAQGALFLDKLERRLTTSRFLFGDTPMLADMAIFPFIRQFAHVDKAWFDHCDYPRLQHWLTHFLESPLFVSIMRKYVQWQPDSAPVWL